MPSNLLIDIYVTSSTVRQLLEDTLKGKKYTPWWHSSEKEFLAWTGQNRHRIDCLVLQSDEDLASLLDQLKRQSILLPAIVVLPETNVPPLEPEQSEQAAIAAENSKIQEDADYHAAIAYLKPAALEQLETHLHQAIDQFLKLTSPLPDSAAEPKDPHDTQHFVLSLQQQRLTEKLKERLGYLGVYYQRNSEHFLRNLSRAEREEVLQKLRIDYRFIVLNYFSQDKSLNQKIDDFVNSAFFADVPVSQIVEIHMELMEEFSNQLKLEGRSEEVLLDYRLTLIDVIAHLCEMYRRSILQEL